MKRALLPRRLPVAPYSLIDVDYAEEGEQCQNCGRLIHYIGIIEPAGEAKELAAVMEQPLRYRIGMDCAETLVAAEEFARHNAALIQLRKVFEQLRRWKRVREVHAVLLENDRQWGAELKAEYLPRFRAVSISIPGASIAFIADRAQNHLITPVTWHKLYGGVASLLTSYGVPVPTDVPSE